MKRCGLVLLAVLLAGCETLPQISTRDKVAPDSALWDRHLEQLAKIETWKLQGRMVLIRGDDGWSATVHWDQNRQSYHLRFIASFGQGTYELTGAPESVTLLTAENEVFQASDPESLLQENMGWEIPLLSLQYWIRGMPDPGVAPDSISLDSAGRLVEMEQSGWQITIHRYQQVNGIDLPGKLFLKNDYFQLRLVIQDWLTAT